jgi:molybdenum cofactor cytidylyltransferase
MNMTEIQSDAGEIYAVVLAAGMSTRMGVPKMTLPWKGSTILGTVLVTLREAGVRRFRVVVGASREEVEQVLDGLAFPVERVFNPKYANGEMMDSIRAGLANLNPEVRAALLVLGDQPQLEAAVAAGLIDRFRQRSSNLIVPSYQMRRGHPWLVGRPLWEELIYMDAGGTMRDFLNSHAGEIDYLIVDTDSILHDLDTPEDYRKAHG